MTQQERCCWPAVLSHFSPLGPLLTRAFCASTMFGPAAKKEAANQQCQSRRASGFCPCTLQALSDDERMMEELVAFGSSPVH